MPIFECSRCNDMTYSAYAGVPRACAECGSATLRVIEGAFAEARSAPRGLGPGDHAALVYEDADSVAPFCARYLTDGIGAGEYVFAALPGELDQAVRDRLSAEALAGIDWHTTGEIYGDFDADRVAATYDSVISSEERTVRILAGPGRADTIEPEEFDRYERLAHEIVTSRGAIVICLIDEGCLPREFSEIAAQRHGLTVSGAEVRRNDEFEYAPA